jgi:hypothetical protein
VIEVLGSDDIPVLKLNQVVSQNMEARDKQYSSQ